MTTILLVEDDAVLLENIALELEMQGYEVKQASNGKQAIKQLDDRSIELIISDISMPEMDGLELLEHVRGTAQLAGMPFIFLSAFSNEESKHKANELGVDGYVVKPFQPSELTRIIQDKLNQNK